jgi:hypothetical protein
MEKESGMIELQKLAQRLRAGASGLELSLDCPADSGLFGWLDVRSKGRLVAVEWRAGRGFGVSLIRPSADPLQGLFEGPDEIFSDLDAAKERILSLLGFEEAGVVLKAAHR